jgi:hypothetical protein
MYILGITNNLGIQEFRDLGIKKLLIEKLRT